MTILLFNYLTVSPKKQNFKKQKINRFMYGLIYLIFTFGCNEKVIDPQPSMQLLPQTPGLKAGVIGTNYYVSKTGNDNNSGTSSSPFRTITQGLDAAVAGDTVFVKGGTYPEFVKFTKSGAAGRLIVLKNYGSDVVTVDGEASRAYCIYIGDKSYITVDGINVENSENYNILILKSQNVVIKNLRSTLSLEITNIPNIELNGAATAISTNITIQNVTTYGGSYGILNSGEVDGMNVIGGDFSYATVDGLGIFGDGTYPRNTIVNGIFSHNNGRQGVDVQACAILTVRNSHLSYNAASGIQIESDSNNILLEDNLCENNCRGGGWANSDYETGMWIFQSSNSIVRRNTIRGNQTGLRLTQASNFLAYNNVITNNTYHPSTFPATQNTSGVDFSESSGTFCNNVLFGNAASDSKLGSIYIYPKGISNVVIKNNIVMNDGSEKDMGFDQSAGSSVISDYNMVYNANRAVNILCDGANETWSAYKFASGQDAHSVISNPLFVNSTNYNLQATSPAINRGVDVGLTSDILGNTLVGLPDIGAYEFTGSNPIPTTTVETTTTIVTSTVYYNTQTSAKATRSDCGTGYTGSIVTYTVAANKYSSPISQADADNQATADLNLNKQAYADANGTCTLIVRRKRR